MKKIKTLILIVSGVVGVALLTIDYIGTVKICSHQWECQHQLADMIVTLLPILPLFLLSLITYRMRDAVVRPWLYFTAVWIPLSMLLIYITPASSPGGWFTMNLFSKGSVAFYLSVLYVIISAILITIVWSETSATEKQKHM